MMYFKGDYPKKAKMIRLGGTVLKLQKDFFKPKHRISDSVQENLHAKL